MATSVRRECPNWESGCRRRRARPISRRRQDPPLAFGFPHHDTEIPETCLSPRRRVPTDPARANLGWSEGVGSQAARQSSPQVITHCGPGTDSGSAPCGRAREAPGSGEARPPRVRSENQLLGQSCRDRETRRQQTSGRCPPGRGTPNHHDRVRQPSHQRAEHRSNGCGNRTSNQGSCGDDDADTERASCGKVSGGQNEGKVRFAGKEAPESEAHSPCGRSRGDKSHGLTGPARDDPSHPRKESDRAPTGRGQAEAFGAQRQDCRSETLGSGHGCGNQGPT